MTTETKPAEHHKAAASCCHAAGKHHQEAATQHEAGNHEAAGHHAHMAHGQMCHASEHMAEASKLSNMGRPRQTPERVAPAAEDFSASGAGSVIAEQSVLHRTPNSPS
jgi:hypothetical protein